MGSAVSAPTAGSISSAHQLSPMAAYVMAAGTATHAAMMNFHGHASNANTSRSEGGGDGRPHPQLFEVSAAQGAVAEGRAAPLEAEPADAADAVDDDFFLREDMAVLWDV